MQQAREKKSAYYDECQISIHATHGWTTDGCQSYAALSDYTDHKSAAVMTSIVPMLKNFVEGGKTTINIVSDSPTLQYRNRKIFYLIHQFAEEYNVTLHWIYLEAGHEKGIPDGTGAVIKQAIQNVITFNPDKPHYTVKHLFNSDLQMQLPSIKIHEYTKDDVVALDTAIPEVAPIKGMMKIHDVLCKNNEGFIIVKDVSSAKSRQVNLSVACCTESTESKVDEIYDECEVTTFYKKYYLLHWSVSLLTSFSFSFAKGFRSMIN